MGTSLSEINALIEIRKRAPADSVNREVPLCLRRLGKASGKPELRHHCRSGQQNCRIAASVDGGSYNA